MAVSIAPKETTDLNQMEDEAFRLRREQLLAKRAVVYFATNRHRPGYQRLRAEMIFRTPTADTGLITSGLVRLSNQMYHRGMLYHRADVLLYDLVSQTALQPDLLGEVRLDVNRASQARMQAIDAINERYGKATVHYAAEDLSRMVGGLTIVDDEDERLTLQEDGRFHGEVVPEDEPGRWRQLDDADDVVQFYDPTDVFGDLAEAIAEAYPGVAPELAEGNGDGGDDAS